MQFFEWWELFEKFNGLVPWLLPDRLCGIALVFYLLFDNFYVFWFVVRVTKRESFLRLIAINGNPNSFRILGIGFTEIWWQSRYINSLKFSQLFIIFDLKFPLIKHQIFLHLGRSRPTPKCLYSISSDNRQSLHTGIPISLLIPSTFIFIFIFLCRFYLFGIFAQFYTRYNERAYLTCLQSIADQRQKDTYCLLSSFTILIWMIFKPTIWLNRINLARDRS